MAAPRDQQTRAERWATSMAKDADPHSTPERLDQERERRQEAHWERLHRQLQLLPLMFFLWSLAITAVIVVFAAILGIVIRAPAPQ